MDSNLINTQIGDYDSQNLVDLNHVDIDSSVVDSTTCSKIEQHDDGEAFLLHMECNKDDQEVPIQKVRKVDNIGRLRPKEYKRKKKSTPSESPSAVKVATNIKPVKDIQTESSSTYSDHNILITNEPCCDSQDSLINTSESYLGQNLYDAVNNLIEDNTLIYESANTSASNDEDENLISDEKWRELIDVIEEQENENPEEQISEDICDESSIYPGHSMTVRSSMILILLYTICYPISGAQLADTLTLISLHCLKSHPGLKSVYMFKRYFADIKSELKKHYFCKYCMADVKEDDIVCPTKNCGKNLQSAKNKSFFIEIPLEDQLKKILKRPGIMSQIKGRFSQSKNDRDGNIIQDIYDGNIYKKFSLNDGPLSEQFPHNISLTWNTDGIPVFKSSKFSLWPFYLVINELPYKQRMLKENMILAGLWFGDCKPFMSCFTKPLIKSLKNLETNGIEYYIGDEKIVTNAFLICGTADLPAKSLVMNCNQFNGKFSCMRCMHPGETFKTNKGGCVHVFPYDASKQMHEKRISESCVADAVSAIENKTTVNGIKGPSFLMTLRSYDFVRSNSIDYMHGVLLGITKLLTKLWISGTYSKEKFSLSSFVDIIDERLLKIKPPAMISRVPRSLSNHFKYWKASELRSWLFYYSLPILHDLLQEEYLLHYACLVQGIFLLSTDRISKIDIQKSFSLLSYFVHMFPSLYSERYVTLNMHSLLHLPQCVEDLGPLWVYSCFPFENVNGLLMELFHGTQNVELQIISGINIVQNMSCMVNELKDEHLLSFADKLSHKPLKRSSVDTGINSGALPLGSGTKTHLTDHLFNQLVTKCGFYPTKILSYKRILLRGVIIHSASYSRVEVRNTFTVKYYDNLEQNSRYGAIDYFILVKKCQCPKDLCPCSALLMAVIHDLEGTGQGIIESNFLGVDVQHITPVKPTQRVSVFDVQKIISVVVCVNFSSDNEKVYVCEFPSLKECD